jgi:hypothetical protein
MGTVTSELINLFSFLLPGFITSFLFYALTAFPKKSEFEAVVIALIYTVVINLIVTLLGLIPLPLTTWPELSQKLLPIPLALVLGFLWAHFYNKDKLHKLLRKLKITNQTSYPSEWYGVFSETQTYVILNLKDSRRILGWPMEWPASPKQGHFVLEDAEWLITGENGGTTRVPLTTVDKIVIDTNNVDIVEFVKDSAGQKGERT